MDEDLFFVECNLEPDLVDRIYDAESLQELAEILKQESADSE